MEPNPLHNTKTVFSEDIPSVSSLNYASGSLNADGSTTAKTEYRAASDNKKVFS